MHGHPCTHTRTPVHTHTAQPVTQPLHTWAQGRDSSTETRWPGGDAGLRRGAGAEGADRAVGEQQGEAWMDSASGTCVHGDACPDLGCRRCWDAPECRRCRSSKRRARPGDGGCGRGPGGASTEAKDAWDRGARSSRGGGRCPQGGAGCPMRPQEKTPHLHTWSCCPSDPPQKPVCRELPGPADESHLTHCEVLGQNPPLMLEEPTQGHPPHPRGSQSTAQQGSEDQSLDLLARCSGMMGCGYGLWARGVCPRRVQRGLLGAQLQLVMLHR